MRISDWSSDVCSSDLVLRIAPLAKQGKAVLAKQVAKALDGRGLRKRGEGRPFYLVGGSWRALARLEMLLVDYPLPINHHYRMEPGRLEELADGMAGLDLGWLQPRPSLLIFRQPTLPASHSDREVL